MVLPWLIAAGYAATDEFHQLFVPGRSGQVSDVILDSAGAAIGVLIMTGIEWLRVRKMAQKKKDRTDKWTIFLRENIL